MAITASIWQTACVIAGTDLVLSWNLERRWPDGRTASLEVRIGTPEWQVEPFPAWRCEVFIEGYAGQPMPIFGATALQSLSLAVRLVRELVLPLAEEATLVEVRSGKAVDPGMLSPEAN